MVRTLRVAGVFFCLAALTACSGKSDNKSAGKGVPVVIKTTRETYMNGRKFCDVYSKITSLEVAKKVSVPVSYSDASRGQIQIYAYTLKPFDPSKPSYIYIDGGPGQNTHGQMPEYVPGEMNEIRFDQRGLGCSAPETYDQYLDASLYSTENTVRDMDEIRKAYGISKWTVYGVSYGTAPATMYASTFADRTSSSVLEGVLGNSMKIHDRIYKAEKLNLVLSKLTLTERRGFESLLIEDSKNGYPFFSYMMNLFYQDRGMTDLPALLRRLIRTDGSLNMELYQRVKTYMIEREREFPYEQQPGGVDETIFNIISCKNLSYRARPSEYVWYTPDTGFKVFTDSESDNNKTCDEVGVKRSDESSFYVSNFRTSVATYYFQGAHDGATNATGALEHFKAVPMGQAYFLLAERGGHNPNLSRLDAYNMTTGEADYVTRSEEKKLFRKALFAQPISDADLISINAQNPEARWKLYLSPSNTLDMEQYFGGLRLVGGSAGLH
jgi:proline iminopeptidase